VRVALRLSLALLAACVLLGCGEAKREETRARFMAMGTLVEVTVYDHPLEAARQAITDVEALFRTLQIAWDPWGEGELGQLNAALKAGEAVVPPADLGALLQRAAQLDEASGGLFEPSIGGLTLLWGFSRDNLAPTAPPPAEALSRSLAAATPLPQMWRTGGRLEGGTGMTLDLGGFAKGEAVDRAIELLRSRGIEHAIVNAGGDLRAIGRHGDRGWRIGVRNPRREGILAAIEISGDESVFTSGDYERFFMLDGRRYHHILDPRDGLPPQHTMSVTVLGVEAATADAAATALFVAGPERWPEVAAALGIDKVMLVDSAGAVHLSAAMEGRVYLPDADTRTIEIRALP